MRLGIPKEDQLAAICAYVSAPGGFHRTSRHSLEPYTTWAEFEAARCKAFLAASAWLGRTIDHLQAEQGLRPAAYGTSRETYGSAFTEA